MGKLAGTGIFFALFGALFAGVGGFLIWMDARFAEDGIAAQGTVTDFATHYDSESGTMYAPVVSYLDDNGQLQRFTSSTSSSSPGYDIGEQVEILYDPGDPSSGIIDSFFERSFLPLIFTGMGSLFVLIGGAMIFYPAYRRRAVSKLKSKGMRIEARVTRVYQDRNIAVNDESPWRVEAEGKHPRTGIKQTFKSDAIWGQPFGIDEGNTVPVFVSASNAKKHFVDHENTVSAPIATPTGEATDNKPWRFGDDRRKKDKPAPDEQT